MSIISRKGTAVSQDDSIGALVITIIFYLVSVWLQILMKISNDTKGGNAS